MADNVPSELIIKLPAVMTAETFTDDEEFEKLYAKVKEAVDAHVPDVTTKTGRDAIASVAYKVARTKTALVKQGKTLTEAWRDQTKKVNAACNTIEERLDKLKDEVRRPLTVWETAEQARVDGHTARLQELIALSRAGFGLPSDEVRKLLSDAKSVPDGEAHWDEFSSQASFAKEGAVTALTGLLATAEKAEADARELEQLRAAQAERDRIEEERRAAEELVNQKREYAGRIIAHIKHCALGMIDGKTYPYAILFRELEEKITIDDALGDMASQVEEARAVALATLREAQKADDERAKLDRAKEDARLAEEASKKAELDAIEKVATAERQAKEAQDRADREIAKAKADADRAAEAERQRLADEKVEADAEQRRRDADKEHRKTINLAIVSELVECAGITKAQAQKIVVHMVSGLVPNVTLKY